MPEEVSVSRNTASQVKPLEDWAKAALACRPEAPIIEYEDRWYIWREVASLAQQVDALINASGAPPGASIGLVARNQPEVLAVLLGLLAGRRSIQMIYPFQSAASLARELTDLRPAVLIAARRDLSTDVTTALYGVGAAAIEVEEMRARAVAGLGRVRSADHASAGEPQIHILTSGTTGPPKRFPISYDLVARHIMGGSANTGGASRTGADDPVPYLLFMPLGNISGIYTSLPPLLRGRRVTLHERFSLDAWHRYVVRHRPAATGVPPSMVQALLDAAIPREDLSSIEFMGIGAAPLDPTIQAAFEEKYDIPLMLSYGATEFGGPVASMTPELFKAFGYSKRGSVGKALPGARLRIVDAETAAECGPGEEGLLDVVSPRIGPEWIRTSDIALIDAEGFLYIRGRADGAIMRGGFKVLPETIERALMLHPAIAAVAVVGVEDGRLGQVPGAAVQLKPGAALTIVSAEQHLRDHVPSTHVPTHWLFVDELPKNPSMKIDRPALKHQFEAAL